MSDVKTRTAPVPARGNLHGMRVIFKPLHGTVATEAVEWTVLERHPIRAHWWLHRRDALGTWVTTFARYSDLEQIIE